MGRPLLVVALLASCGDALPQADNAALIVSAHMGSGVYVGGGRVLTNWHVCLAPLFDESLAPADHLRLYDNPGGGASPYLEGPAPTAWYCLAPITNPYDLDYQVVDQDSGGCVPLSNLPGQRLSFSRIGAETSPDRLLFADWTIDACLFEVNADARSVLDARLDSLVLANAAVQVGQRVVVAGEQLDAINEVGVEECQVTGLPALVVDPDPIAPSPLEVPSFTIDCQKIEHGSSGSPVFDAETGRLLGLVWTGIDLGAAGATVYVSAISEWRARLGARPTTEYSQLAALLDAQAE